MDVKDNCTRGSVLREKARRNIWQFGTSHKKMENTDRPIVFEFAKDRWLYDVDGNSYFDALSGVWVVNVGHGEHRIAKAMGQQAKEMNYVLSEEGFANIRAIELSEQLLKILPDDFDRVYFTSGGSEAVEMALRMARIYHRLQKEPRRNRFISRRGSYHGATLLALSITGNNYLSHVVGPPPPGLTKIAHPYCFRCEFSHRDPNTCGFECAHDLEAVILREGADNVAAFIAEPIATASGVAIPPKGYWKEIRRICDKYGVLLILDEVVTGFGRLGTMFGMEWFDVIPDIVVMAKGITSGYSPLGALATSKKITSKIPDRAFLIPGFTYTGHPVSCVAALTNIDIIKKDGLLLNATKRGIQLKNLLHEKLDNQPFVGDIRCLGLLACVEIVRDKSTRAPFNYNDGVVDILTDFFLQNKVYVRLLEGYIHIGPPLTVTEEEIAWLTDVVKDAFEQLSRLLS
ncbi:aspartate aminotransferase family protein [Clostridiaceae bacterium M8S5]|nr:aspartate aminotransferase family protein [Clostridiaceae bacterium M8S5]